MRRLMQGPLLSLLVLLAAASATKPAAAQSEERGTPAAAETQEAKPAETPPEPEAPSTGPIVVPPGRVLLPLSGLEIDLPKDPRQGFSWKLSASFSNVEGGFDARDVVDELVDDKLVAGTWIHVGYFNAGDPKQVVAEAVLGDAWEGDVTFAGIQWAARGGKYTFEDKALGQVPCLVICGRRDDHKDLLIYHYYIDTPGITRNAMLAGLPHLAVVDQAVHAWLADGSVQIPPLRRPEVRRRGAKPNNVVHLDKSNLDVALPDDGYVWLVRPPEKDDNVDWLDRMAPALPEISLEVMRMPGKKVADVIESINTPRANVTGPKTLPPGWAAGPALIVDGTLERVVAFQSGADAILVGVLVTSGPSLEAVFSSLKPMLESIAGATVKAK